jgi:hypothetical protein
VVVIACVNRMAHCTFAGVGSMAEEEQVRHSEDPSGSNTSATVSRYARVRVWVV